MEAPLCDFCSAQRALVYCKSDAARLCLLCDGLVHSANALACRHLRGFVCDRCLAQPADFRCLDDGLSFCRTCDCCPGTHRFYQVSCYSGCPSMEELSRMFSPPIDSDGSVSTMMVPAVGGQSFADACGEPREATANSMGFTVADFPGGLECYVPNYYAGLMVSDVAAAATSSLTTTSPEGCAIFPRLLQQQGLMQGGHKRAKLVLTNFKDFRMGDQNELDRGFSSRLSGYNIDNSNEIYRSLQNCLMNDSEFDDIITKNKLLAADPNQHIANISEVPSAEHDCINLQWPCLFHPGSVGQSVNSNADHLYLNSNSNNNANLGYHSGNVPSMSVSVSNLTGESSLADYQDGGVSSKLYTGDSPWEMNLEPGHPQARNEAKMRYNEKKKSRMFGKQVRYASRKARADTRKRVKGRFVKSNGASESDPAERS